MKMVLASGNQKKLVELEALLAPLGFELVTQSELGVPEAEETGLTFVENALIKARNAAAHTGLPAISDDSGLEVDALQGAPGIYSARFSGVGATDARNNALLVEQLQALPGVPLTARYHAVIAVMRHANDPVPLIAHGAWEGEILLTPQGDGGFGYDPHFFDPLRHCTAAQMPAEEKNRISHRALALDSLLQQLKNLREKI
ncbi:RdgB/HAM1 family non-canonical purine NTP pyrophosphatase [Isoalcanivorax beigongshangi]|uniref:dITP/XTP pyrophosphatase n=1 Tax=Isoalcanivorax beigongshangi TaxID=3238810 RepID=A0ABV4ADM7_9GAMM